MAQALLRHWLFGARLESALLPMTGVAFILYTFYMVTDPATTPSGTRAQVIFGGAVAFTYGFLMVLHIRIRLVLRIKYRVRGPRARHGDSGLETNTAHAASNALCAIKRETRLADRAAEHEALPEPAVAQ